MDPYSFAITILCGSLPLLLGGVAIVGWYTRSPHLIQIHPSFVPMQFNTALGFLFSGVGLLLLGYSEPQGVTVASLAILVIGGLTLFEYLTRTDVGIDQVFLTHYITVKTSHPGRMAPNTALCFTMTAMAFLMSTSVQHSTIRMLTAGMLGAIIFAFGAIALLGYLFQLEPAYGWGHLTRMAMPTAVGFGCVGLGLLVVSCCSWIPLDVTVRSQATIAVLSVGVLLASLLTVAVHYMQRDRHLMQRLQSSYYDLQQEVRDRKKAENETARSREELRNLTHRLQTIREEEKTHIAREVHDELGQALTALKIDLAFLELELEKNQERLREKVRAMGTLVDDTVLSVQRISLQLRPKLLDLLGFQEAMKWQAEEFEKRTGIHCDVTLGEESIHMAPPQSIGLFRVLQETLSNVARHAKATEVQIRFRQHQGSLELMIRDDGQGITRSQIEDSASLGLIGMRERMLHLGGIMTIQGWESLGTAVTFTIPRRP